VGRPVHALALGVAVITGGCAQIFGFDETSPYDDDGIRLSWQRKLVGATVVDQAMDLTAGSATILITDAEDPSGLRRVPCVLEDPDTWFAELPVGTTGSILYDLPEANDDLIRIWAFPSRTLQGVYGVLGHPDPEPAPVDAQLDLSITLDTAYNGETLQMYTVGAWSYRNFPEVPVPGMGITAWDPPAVPYASSASITGRPLVRIRSGDAVALLRYAGPLLSGFLAVPPFDQQNGIDVITGTMSPVALDATLDVTFMTTIAGPRFAATRPVVAGLSQSWSVHSSPGTSVTNSAGPALTSGGLLETDTGAINTAYGNPFPWDTTVTFSTGEARTFLPPGAVNPSTLYAGLYSVVTPAPGLVFDLPQGLPITVSLAGRALTSDGMTVTLDRTKAVEISFGLDREACDMYGVSIYELVDNGAGTFVHTGRVAINGVTPSFTIPGDLFTTGVPYTMRAVCQLGGVPNLLEGDLVTRAWPLHIGYLDSGVFTVAP
jgi:hypothetical protein